MGEGLVDRIARAALDCHLEERRDAILIPLGDLAGRLPRVAIPRDQLESDIRRLAAEWPIDGRHPLRDWLASAALLAREARHEGAAQLDDLVAEADCLPTDGPITAPAGEARYKAALAEHCRRLSSVGLPIPARRVDFDALFVDVMVEVQGDGWVPITDLSARLLPGARLILVGGAGVGKTIACRALIRAACAGPDVLPVWIRLRAWDPKMDLLDWFAERSPDVRLGRDQVESAMDAGRAVLFLDGFDEVARDADRERLGDWMGAVRERWPDTAMVVTTRPDLYDPALLTGTRVRVTYLNADERARLIGRWCSAVHGNQSDLADAMVASIIARLSESAALDVMIDTPLMVALVVMVHMAHGDLPTERQRLVEQCVDTLLETWPQNRGDENPVSDPDLSRAAVERLALYIAFPEDGEPALGGPLELVQGLAERALVDEGAPGGRSLVRRWVEHLIRACGLLHRTSKGWVEFSHRVFADALVASAVERIHAGRVDTWILRHYDPLSDAAVELLMARQRTPDFRAGLSRGVLDLLRDRFDRGVELLRTAARAGVEWGDEDHRAHFDAIYERLIEVVVEELDGETRDYLDMVSASEWPRGFDGLASWVGDDPVARSALEERARRALDVGCGGEFLGAVVWSLRSQWISDLEHILSARLEQPDPLAACARLWPAGFVGWARVDQDESDSNGSYQVLERRVGLQDEVACGLPAAGAIDRMDLVCDNDLLMLATMTLRNAAGGDPLVAALSLRVAETALRLGCSSSAAAQRFMQTSVSALAGVSGFLAPRPGEMPVMTRSRRPPFAPADPRRPVGRSRHELLRGMFVQGHHDTVRASLIGGPVDIAPPRTPDPFLAALTTVPVEPKLVSEIIPWGWSSMEALALMSGPIPGLPFEWPHDWRPQPLHPVSAKLGDKCGATLSPVAHAPGIVHTRLVPAMEIHGGRMPAYYRISRRWLLDAHIAGCHAEVLEQADTVGAYGHRLRSVNLLEVWPLIDESLGLGASAVGGVVRSARHALYLALGWSAHTTTGRWPDSRLWSDLFASRPQDWLPRAHWHLCWLAHRPTDGRHRRAFLKAVQVGCRDPELALVAQRMAAWRPARGTTTW